MAYISNIFAKQWCTIFFFKSLWLINNVNNMTMNLYIKVNVFLLQISLIYELDNFISIIYYTIHNYQYAWFYIVPVYWHFRAVLRHLLTHIDRFWGIVYLPAVMKWKRNCSRSTHFSINFAFGNSCYKVAGYKTLKHYSNHNFLNI